MAERVSFSSSSGPMLAGLIDPPAGPVRGWGVFAHGFTLGKDCPAAARICKQLAAEGVGMLRFDNLGIGDSQGDWGDGSFSHKVDDTVLAAAFLAAQGTPADLLVGHSFGGAAVLAAASRVPDLRAVVTVGAPFHPASVEHQFDTLVNRVMAEGDAPWHVGGKVLTLRRSFIEDVRRADLTATIAELGMPLMVMHSPQDDTVPLHNASDIFNAAKHPRNFIALEGTDHLLTARGQAARAARIIRAWADQYLAED